MCRDSVCVSVCLSSTICVCTYEKWFRTFVRGTVRTEQTIFFRQKSNSSRNIYTRFWLYNVRKPRHPQSVAWKSFLQLQRPPPPFSFWFPTPLRLWTGSSSAFAIIRGPATVTSVIDSTFVFCLSPTMRHNRRHPIRTHQQRVKR